MSIDVEAIGGIAAVRGASLTALALSINERRDLGSCHPWDMFHLELRQFPHVARAFNLVREELETRILTPWVQGRPVELDDRRWAPERAKLTIYEGRALATEEIGMGRGWANAARSGEAVTERMLADAERSIKAPPALTELKQELLARCAGGRVGLNRVVELARFGEPSRRASERLALAEQAVWELLHEGHAGLVRAGAPLAPADWQPALLSWAAWGEEERAAVFLEAR
jgi:hypothetical protein